MIDLRKKAEELHDRHSDTFQIEVDEIESQLRTLVEGYSVPLEEAIRSVVNRNAPEYKSSTAETNKSNSQIKVGDINTSGQWIDLQIKIVDLWDPTSDSIDQVGLAGDETGTIKFTKWSKSNLPPLEENGNYLLKNVVTD